MRSASSSTSRRRLEQSKLGVSSMCWSSRPGVHTRMFMRTSRSRSSLTSLPPITRPALNECLLPAFLSTSKICRASSRVGEMTRAPRPSMGVHCRRYSVSSTGMMNESVLPEPVLAAPRTSLPARASGSAPRWISVISTHEAAPRPSSVRLEIGSSANRRSRSGRSMGVDRRVCSWSISAFSDARFCCADWGIRGLVCGALLATYLALLRLAGLVLLLLGLLLVPRGTWPLALLLLLALWWRRCHVETEIKKRGGAMCVRPRGPAFFLSLARSTSSRLPGQSFLHHAAETLHKEQNNNKRKRTQGCTGEKRETGYELGRAAAAAAADFAGSVWTRPLRRLLPLLITFSWTRYAGRMP